MNNVITASRLNCLLKCQRQHFYKYELGLRKDSTGIALRFGSAWARGMEARWLGASFDEALLAAIPEGVDLEAYDCSTVSALLAGYYDYYGPIETVGSLQPEVKFQSNFGKVKGLKDFTIEGKMDGLGHLKDGRNVLLEAKTTSDSLLPDSGYWDRLTFNMQVLQYIGEARKLGHDVQEVYYDVTRKPSIAPKMIDDLDEQGLKIVTDANGERVLKKDGSPRLTGDTKLGYVVKQHIETPDEFCDRLYKDTQARPEFYFCRKSVPILEADLTEFENQRVTLARMINFFRKENSWPRNVSGDTCDYCEYKSFCLQNLTVNPQQPPAGFSVQPFNPELIEHDNNISETSNAV